jgi:hypothetical protein
VPPAVDRILQRLGPMLVSILLFVSVRRRIQHRNDFRNQGESDKQHYEPLHWLTFRGQRLASGLGPCGSMPITRLPLGLFGVVAAAPPHTWPPCVRKSCVAAEEASAAS